MIKVLVVDDSPIATKMVARYLTDRGYKVKESNSAFGVPKLINEFQPRVMLMDLDLPGLSGDRLIEMCRKGILKYKVRIILFSSSKSEELQRLVDRGIAHDYFVKGASLKTLEKKILKQAEAV